MTSIVKNELLIAFDVDGTLILDPGSEPSDNDVYIKCPYSGTMERRQVHWPHVKLLKEKKARGYHVTLWSAAGYSWALAVADALTLLPYTDVVQSKPMHYVDDLPVQEWMPYRIFIKTEEK